MYRTAWLALLLLLACRESRSGMPETGTPDVATRTGSAEMEDDKAGVEYEAPRLIPAVRAQISRLQEEGGASEGNLTAFRSGAGTLVDAMQTDLNRVGVTDSGYFRVLGDSVLRAIGGGAGTPPDLKPEDVRPAAAQVERLIGLYEERMRAAAR
ncbi:MAG TPA: hypothetical protein VG500_15255 [Gemmatimonadales bacterium]|jgi:hypothetical protein|nr:hypothetical protein [Gemmatimonadales bacterium]